MDHAAAEDLDPAGSLAESAAFSAALEAGDIDLSGRLREREMMRTELCLRLRSEQLLCEYIERSLEIGKCYVLVDDQSLDLMEECVASTSSERNTRPGEIIRIGSLPFSMTRACTGDVCVRRRISFVI